MGAISESKSSILALNPPSDWQIDTNSVKSIGV